MRRPRATISATATTSSTARPTPITCSVGPAVSKRIEAFGDRDWFSVTLDGGNSYMLELKGAASGNGSLADPDLRLHDVNGALIAENDDNGGPDSLLTFTPAASGTFYLEAGAHADGSVGTYKLVISPPANRAPVITSNGGGDAATLFMRESLGFVTAVAGSDPDPGTTVAYAITGGTDWSQFQIDPATGALHFTLATDYEHPADADHNNTYIVQVGVTDGSLWDTQTLTVVVTDANDAVLASAAPADFNHDGRSDILWRHDNGTIALWTMSGATKIADRVVSGMGNDWILADAADFNGDGKVDLLWRHDSGVVALWTMDGAQKVADQVFASLGNEWHIEKTADFNGDGKTDILWRHDNGTVALWTMNGAQKVADQIVAGIGNDWHFIDTADFNGDHKADILWRHDNGTVALWTMNGAQKVADQIVAGIGNDWHFIDTADFNGDHKADILWRHDSGAVALWTMKADRRSPIRSWRRWGTTGCWPDPACPGLLSRQPRGAGGFTPPAEPRPAARRHARAGFPRRSPAH